MSNLVAPHGGTLVDRFTPTTEAADALTARAKGLPSIELDARELADLELIAIGAASPLTGFVGKADYESILATTRLASGVVWPFPFTLATEVVGDELALHDGKGRLWGVLTVKDVFTRDTDRELEAVYGTKDASHPGVAYTLSRPTRLVGGDVEVLPLPKDLPFAQHRLTPR